MANRDRRRLVHFTENSRRPCARRGTDPGGLRSDDLAPIKGRFAISLGSVWGRRGADLRVRLESLWVRLEVNLGLGPSNKSMLNRGQSRVGLKSMLSRCMVSPGSMLSFFGVDLMPLWGLVWGSYPGLIRGWSRVSVGPRRGQSGVNLRRSAPGPSGAVLGSIRGRCRGNPWSVLG